MTLALVAVGSYLLGAATVVGLIFLAADRYKPRERDPKRRAFYRALSEAMLSKRQGE